MYDGRFRLKNETFTDDLDDPNSARYNELETQACHRVLRTTHGADSKCPLWDLKKNIDMKTKLRMFFFAEKHDCATAQRTNFVFFQLDSIFQTYTIKQPMDSCKVTSFRYEIGTLSPALGLSQTVLSSSFRFRLPFKIAMEIPKNVWSLHSETDIADFQPGKRCRRISNCISSDTVNGIPGEIRADSLNVDLGINELLWVRFIAARSAVTTFQGTDAELQTYISRNFTTDVQAALIQASWNDATVDGVYLTHTSVHIFTGASAFCKQGKEFHISWVLGHCLHVTSRSRTTRDTDVMVRENFTRNIP